MLKGMNNSVKSEKNTQIRNPNINHQLHLFLTAYSQELPLPDSG